MKALALAVVLLASSALAQFSPVRSQQWVQPLNATAPTTGTVGCIGGVQATRGLQLDSVQKVRVTIKAPSNFAGGYLTPYIYDPALSDWTLYYLGRGYIDSTANTESWEVPPLLPYGCVYWIAESISLSGAGSTVTITATAFTGYK